MAACGGVKIIEIEISLNWRGGRINWRRQQIIAVAKPPEVAIPIGSILNIERHCHSRHK